MAFATEKPGFMRHAGVIISVYSLNVDVRLGRRGWWQQPGEGFADWCATPLQTTPLMVHS